MHFTNSGRAGRIVNEQLASTAMANIEEMQCAVRRPRLLFFAIAFGAVIIFAGGGPLLAAAAQEKIRVVAHTASPTIVPFSSPPPPPIAQPPPPPTAVCGDGKCEPPESSSSCFEDCPGVTTPAMCGEEPHSDPGGEAVAWGLTHKTASAAECCERCATHAADPKNSQKKCNSWVFCYLPQCWSLDTGHKHTFGECWLKWQVDPSHPLYGQRGRYSDLFRSRHRMAHMSGNNVDGTPRNLTVPTHVPWTGGVMGARVDLSVKWETGPEGMKSSKGDAIVAWRAWESADENRRRGVPEALLGGHPAFGDPPKTS